jgi:UDP-perosamine 4-acetyltransferase
MQRPVILLGGGGHAKVLADALCLNGVTITGYTDVSTGTADLREHVTHLGNDDVVCTYNSGDILLINGLGSVGDTSRRRRIFNEFTARGYVFSDVIHPSAIASSWAIWESGLQLLAGAIVGPGAHLAANVLINTRAVVEHDCRIGSHSHIASGAVLCGHCDVGSGVHVGAGATINQCVRIGDGSVIASGAVVIHDVPPHTLVAGVPATIKRNVQ